jgi:hypothetical protein
LNWKFSFSAACAAETMKHKKKTRERIPGLRNLRSSDAEPRTQ